MDKSVAFEARRKELADILPDDAAPLVGDVIEEIIFLEGKLEELKKLPFIQVDAKNPMRQRNTPAAKMYKEFLQQYINCVKVIEGVIYRDKRLEGDEVDTSPLRKWFENHVNSE